MIDKTDLLRIIVTRSIEVPVYPNCCQCPYCHEASLHCVAWDLSLYGRDSYLIRKGADGPIGYKDIVPLLKCLKARKAEGGYIPEPRDPIKKKS